MLLLPLFLSSLVSLVPSDTLLSPGLSHLSHSSVCMGSSVPMLLSRKLGDMSLLSFNR